MFATVVRSCKESRANFRSNDSQRVKRDLQIGCVDPPFPRSGGFASSGCHTASTSPQKKRSGRSTICTKGRLWRQRTKPTFGTVTAECLLKSCVSLVFISTGCASSFATMGIMNFTILWSGGGAAAESRPRNAVANLRLFKLHIAESPRRPLSSCAILATPCRGSVVDRAPRCGRELPGCSDAKTATMYKQKRQRPKPLPLRIFCLTSSRTSWSAQRRRIVR